MQFLFWGRETVFVSLPLLQIRLDIYLLMQRVWKIKRRPRTPGTNELMSGDPGRHAARRIFVIANRIRELGER